MKKVFLLLLTIPFTIGIVQAQNVGIGLFNTPPVLRLHVSSITDSNLLLLENRNPLGLQQLTSMYFRTGSYYTGAIKTIGASTNEARLGFFTYSSSSINGLLERMSILDNGNVGISTTTPSADFDVNGTIRIRGNGAAAGRVLTSDASGNATWQAPSGGAQVGFRGVINNNLDVTQAAGELQLIGFAEEFDDGNGFNGSAGTFTAPSAGVYQFVVNLHWYQSTNTTGTSVIIARLLKNNSDFLEQTNNIFTNNTSYSQLQNITSICKLNAGDVVTVKVDPQVSYTYTIVGGGSSAGRFSGAKLY